MTQLTAQIRLMNFIDNGIDIDGIQFIWMKIDDTYQLRTIPHNDIDPLMEMQRLCMGYDGRVCQGTYQAYVQLLHDLQPQSQPQPQDG